MSNASVARPVEDDETEKHTDPETDPNTGADPVGTDPERRDETARDPEGNAMGWGGEGRVEAERGGVGVG